MASWTSLTFALIPHALARPRVAVELLSLAWSMRRRDWWRQAPFLPLPPREYIRWRMYTAYGDENAVPPVRDVLRLAHWRADLFRE
jgi:hypothetical protein